MVHAGLVSRLQAGAVVQHSRAKLGSFRHLRMKYILLRISSSNPPLDGQSFFYIIDVLALDVDVDVDVTGLQMFSFYAFAKYSTVYAGK